MIFFFENIFLVWFFLSLYQNIFKVIWRARIFFNLTFPCASKFFVLRPPPPRPSLIFLRVRSQAKRGLQQVRWCPCIVWLPPKLIQSEVSIRVICNNLVCWKTGLNVDGKTPFNKFCGDVKKQVAHFLLPVFPYLKSDCTKTNNFCFRCKIPQGTKLDYVFSKLCIQGAFDFSRITTESTPR